MPRAPQQEAPAIRRLRLPLFARAPRAVAGVIVEAQQDRVSAGGGGREPRGELQRHPDVDAAVVDAVLQQHRRVGRARLHVRIGTHREQRPELILLRHGAVLGDVAGAVGARLRADLVDVADADDGRVEEIGPLRDRAADEDPAGTAAHHAEAFARGVAAADQPFGDRDAVLPGVGLRRLPARAMPVVAVDAAAAHVGDHQDAAALQPRQQARAECRLLHHAVRAVAIQDQRIAAVELRARGQDDRRRHLDAVVAGDLDLACLDAFRRVEAAGGNERERATWGPRAPHRPPVDGVVACDAGPAAERDDRAVLLGVGVGEPDGAFDRQFDARELRRAVVRQALEPSTTPSRRVM